MKKLYTILFLMAFGFAPMVNAQTSVFSDDFESGYTTATSLAGVNGWNVGAGTAESINDAGQGYNGSDNYGYFTTGAFTMISQKLAVEADKEYTFKFYSYKTGAGAVRLKVIDTEAAPTTIAEIDAKNTADAWIERTVTFTAPKTEELIFQAIQNWGAGFVKIDNVTVTCNNCSTLSTKDHSAFEFGMYPNPVKDMLNINTQEALQKIEVADLLGRTVLIKEHVNKSVNFSSLNRGVYVLKLTSEKGISTKKIIKE